MWVLLLLVLVAGYLAVVIFALPGTRYEVDWTAGPILNATLRRRLFPWFTDNLTLFGVVAAKHYELIVADQVKYAPTLRHEFVHLRQAAEHRFFLLRYLVMPSFRKAMEAEAVAAQDAATPTWKVLA